MTILATGAWGFIDKLVARLMLARYDTVVGLDTLNDERDPPLKTGFTPGPSARDGASRLAAWYREYSGA